MKEHIPLAQELVAEIQASLPEAARKVAHRLQVNRELGQQLRDRGLVRSVPNPPPTLPLRVMAIATATNSLSAFGGVVYGAAALAVETICDGPVVRDSRQSSRAETGDCDHLGLNDRLKWRAYYLTYDLLEEAITNPPSEHPDLILVNLPLFLVRSQMLLGTVEAEEVMEEWERLQTRITQFWAGPGRAFYPFDPVGPLMAAVRLRGTGSLFVALKNRGESILADAVAPGTGEFMAANIRQVRQAGTLRLLNQVIGAGERTAAYSSAGLDLDYRTEPAVLLERGVIAFSFRVKPRARLWQIEIPGGIGDWDTARLDGVCQRLMATTYVDHEDALPVPLWYATQRAVFPVEILHFLRKAVQKELGE